MMSACLCCFARKWRGGAVFFLLGGCVKFVLFAPFMSASAFEIHVSGKGSADDVSLQGLARSWGACAARAMRIGCLFYPCFF